jgi:hypothetical protein
MNADAVWLRPVITKAAHRDRVLADAGRENKSIEAAKGGREHPGVESDPVDLEDDISKYQIPVGAAGQVAIYTEHWHHVSLLRKIRLRMRSWENYVFLEGH